MLYGAQPPRRQDAQRNRSAIVRAAGEMMTSRQPFVGMPEIARRAGVGLATLYRHFPDRNALADAVLLAQLERLEACARANAGHPAAFRLLLDAILRTQIVMRPLVRLIRRLDASTRERYLNRMIAALAEPLRQAQAHGYVRTDLVPADLALLFTMIEGVVDAAADVTAAQAAAGRTVDLALDGVFRA